MTRARMSYAPVTFADLPGWAGDDHAAALRAFRLSCDRLVAAGAAATAVDAAGAATAQPKRPPPPPAVLAACEKARRLPPATDAAGARKFFETEFVPHRIAHDGPTGLLTGYYEPLVEGSRTSTPRFKVPLHRRPPDLVNLVEETQRGAVGAGFTHGRRTAEGVEPFPARSEIDRGALAAQNLELVYLADPVEKFFLQIQGSGRVRLPDGTLIRIGYDGKNGHPYTSVGRYLIDKGIIGADSMTLQALGDWLRADPERGRQAMWQNKSYVFFRELRGREAAGPIGALDIPLTEGRSLAVDAGHHQLGLPIYVTAPTLTHATRSRDGFRRLMIAQDVGSAIKGPERGDIYFGSGDAAGRLAGVTKHPGRFHVLLPREMATVPPSRPTQPAEPPAPAKPKKPPA